MSQPNPTTIRMPGRGGPPGSKAPLPVAPSSTSASATASASTAASTSASATSDQEEDDVIKFDSDDNEATISESGSRIGTGHVSRGPAQGSERDELMDSSVTSDEHASLPRAINGKSQDEMKIMLKIRSPPMTASGSNGNSNGKHTNSGPSSSRSLAKGKPSARTRNDNDESASGSGGGAGQKRKRAKRDIDDLNDREGGEGDTDDEEGVQSGSGSGSDHSNSNASESEDELALSDPSRRRKSDRKSNGHGQNAAKNGRIGGSGRRGLRMRVKVGGVSGSGDGEEGEGEGDGVDEMSYASSSTAPPKRKTQPKRSRRRVIALDDSASDNHSSYSDHSSSHSSNRSNPTSSSSIAPTFLHRQTCDKCHRLPAADLHEDATRREAARRKKGGKKRTGGAGGNADLLVDEVDSAEALGGWTECTKCCSSYHWSCLPPAKRNELLKYDKLLPPSDRQMPGSHLHMDDTIDLQCPRCTERISKSCMICRVDRKLVPQSDSEAKPESDAMIVDVDAEVVKPKEAQETTPPLGLLFRCVRCKRAAHYDHLPPLDGEVFNGDAIRAAEWYQSDEDGQDWQCADCRKWTWKVETIIAWRPSPVDAKEPKRDREDLPDYKGLLPREYLVKWADRGFRHVEWLPHDWMALMEGPKLLSFLRTGSRLTLDTESGLSKKQGDDEQDALQAMMEVTQDDEHRGTSENGDGQPRADPGALANIPTSWSTVDRVLGVWVLRTTPARKPGKGKNRVDSEELEDDQIKEQDLREGRKPSEDLITLEEWEASKRTRFEPEDVDEVAKRVAWAYIKWQDLQYNSCSYDTPPPRSSPLWPAFKQGLSGYLRARKVVIPTLSEKNARLRDKRSTVVDFEKMTSQPECIVGGTLMDFQLEGLNWLLYKWYNLESCILADDMGLGKTVQIASLLGLLGSSTYNIYPFLVVVPNSTLQNWIREFEKWAPHLRVVPYYGVGDSRTIIQEWELFHHKGKATASGLKAHVVVTSYEGITMKNDFNVLNKIPRWEMLIVDEAQRLKSDKTLIYRRLREMKVVHKVLLTGTPLNNTVREILNLLHFLDPPSWQDLDGLEKKYAEPDEALFKELREKIAPYMLRRRKDDVLDLPAKNEMIVPLSMRPLQKQVYKSVMEKNADLMEALARATQKETLSGKPQKVKAVHNMLMQLRKCAQHPYLNNPALEDMAASSHAQQQSLIDASAKLVFLKTLLPKLKARGHRVLIFSQFVIALNLLQDFFDGEGYKFLRLDGSTPQDVRQKDIDKFNAPDSEYFVYMLSTRAGGVGINLATADTVIIADLDFNPHLDMQAIARAHRFGQKKKVMVFRLMMKKTVEETIMQIGKKKLMLDHLIVQTMQKDDEEDFSAILLNGARAIFEESDEQDVTYDADAVDAMVTELETREEVKEKTVGFTFAPIYDSKTKKLAELEEEVEDQAGAADFWKDVLERANADRAKADQEMYGRGARRAAQAANKGGAWDQQEPDESMLSKVNSKRADSPASDYAMSDAAESDGGGEDFTAGEAKEDLSGLGVSGPSGGIVAIASGRKRLKVARPQGVVPVVASANGKPIKSRSGKRVVVAGTAVATANPEQVLNRTSDLDLANVSINDLATGVQDYPLLPQETLHVWNQLGKVQAYREAGAFFHAAKSMVALLHEVCERIQIKGQGNMLQNVFDTSIPAANRAKRYKHLCQRVDHVLRLSGAQPIFATREGLAIAAYLFSAEGVLMYEIPRAQEYAAPVAAVARVQPTFEIASLPQASQQVNYQQQQASPEYGYRTLGLANGMPVGAIAVDDEEDDIVVEVCPFCRGPHPAGSCDLLLTVPGIERCIMTVGAGDDAQEDKGVVLNYLHNLRNQKLQEMEVLPRAMQPIPLDQPGPRSARTPAVVQPRPAPPPAPAIPAPTECLICNGPPHPVPSCPVMKSGTPQIHAAMARLVGTPVYEEMRVIMDKQLLMGMAALTSRRK